MNLQRVIILKYSFLKQIAYILNHNGVTLQSELWI